MTIGSATPSTSRRRGTLLGVVAIVLWSSLAVMALFTAELPPFEVLAISFGIGGLCGIGLLASRGAGSLKTLRQPWPAFALSVIALFGYHALYFFAFRHAPAVEVNLINYLWPLLIVVFAACLPGVRLRTGQLVGTALGLVGVLVMVSRGQRLAFDTAHFQGYLAAFLAALTWAAYSVLNQRFHAVPSAAIAGSCMVVAVLAAVAHALFETTLMPTTSEWCVLALMGVGPVGIAFWLWDHGTKHGDIAVLGTLAYAAPLLSTLLLLISGRAEPHVGQAIAVVLLIVGAWLSVRTSRASL